MLINIIVNQKAYVLRLIDWKRIQRMPKPLKFKKLKKCKSTDKIIKGFTFEIK